MIETLLLKFRTIDKEKCHRQRAYTIRITWSYLFRIKRKQPCFSQKKNLKNGKGLFLQESSSQTILLWTLN